MNDFHLPLAPKYSVWRSCLYKSHFDNYDCVISSCARVIGPFSIGDHEYTLNMSAQNCIVIEGDLPG